MAKVLYSAAMSLDGFIAGPGGDMSWMSGVAVPTGPNPLVDELMEQTAVILAGGGTFRGDDPNRGTGSEGAFAGRWEGPTFVLTRQPPEEPVAGITFVGDLGEALAAAKTAAGGRYVNVLGAGVARSCLDAGALDEVLVSVVPVLLGDGVRLFEHAGGTVVRLEPIAASHTPPLTNMRFRVVTD